MTAMQAGSGLSSGARIVGRRMVGRMSGVGHQRTLRQRHHRRSRQIAVPRGAAERQQHGRLVSSCCDQAGEASGLPFSTT
jgi:hypothetical protein